LKQKIPKIHVNQIAVFTLVVLHSKIAKIELFPYDFFTFKYNNIVTILYIYSICHKSKIIHCPAFDYFSKERYIYLQEFIMKILTLLLSFFFFLSGNFIINLNSYALPQTQEDLEYIAEHLVNTGMNENNLKPLVNPIFTSVSLASMLLDENEPVFIVATGKLKPLKERDVIILPQKIMVWHEVLNMIAQDKSFAVTYSPISGTLATYNTRRDNLYLQLQADGRQYNANSVLMDINTNSRWSQMYGICFLGTLMGSGLELLPSYWTTWDKALRFYIDKDNARVLLTPRSTNKRYGKDPYGSYNDPESFYYNDQLIYPISNLDTRMRLKEMVIGLELDKKVVAININYVKKKGIVNFFFDKYALVAVHDKALDVVRIFDRTVWFGKDPLVMVKDSSKTFKDLQTQSTWDFDGVCRGGNYLGTYMKEYYGIYSFWYSFAANNPETETVPGKSEVPDSALEIGAFNDTPIGEELKGPVEESGMNIPWN